MDPALFSKRIIIICGKGGTGKSVVASALGLLASRRGHRVLIVEHGVTPVIPAMFAVSNSRAKPNGVIKINDRLHSCNLDPFALIDDFVVFHLKIPFIGRRVLRSPMYRHFTAIAPGIKELISLYTLVRIEMGALPSFPRFDLIIFDAPATGHSIGLFKVLHDSMSLVKSGTLASHTRTILSILQDPEKTLFTIVALPEEMPVNESIALSHTLTDELRYPGGLIFLNAMPPVPFDSTERKHLASLAKLLPSMTGGEKDLLSHVRCWIDSSMRWIQRGEMACAYRDRITRTLHGSRIVEIPLFKCAQGPTVLVEKVTAHLSQNTG
jgi:hypothetical protein